MFSKINFIKGAFINFFNPHISVFAFVSSDNNIHKTATIYRNVKISCRQLVRILMLPIIQMWRVPMLVSFVLLLIIAG